jgi:hypothetical protein
MSQQPGNTMDVQSRSNPVNDESNTGEATTSNVPRHPLALTFARRLNPSKDLNTEKGDDLCDRLQEAAAIPPPQQRIMKECPWLAELHARREVASTARLMEDGLNVWNSEGASVSSIGSATHLEPFDGAITQPHSQCFGAKFSFFGSQVTSQASSMQHDPRTIKTI